MIDIRDGKYEDYFRVLNIYQDSISEYTPVNLHLLSRIQYYQVSTTNPQLPYIVSQWQGNVGQNGSTVYIESSESSSLKTQAQKKRVQTSTYDFLYNNLKWRKIELEIIELIAKEGNAVVMLNAEGELIVHSIFRFNVYFESNQKTRRYAFRNKEGNEEQSMRNLKHGIDIYHIQDPITSSCAISPSRLDACFSFILLEQKGVKANTALFANGLLMNIFLKLNPDLLPKLQDQSKDKNGKTFWQKFMEPVLDRFSGVEKAGRVGYIPGLEEIIEVGKNNKEAQFYELIRELTPERVAWAYSMTLADFGAGKSTTYNNATTFDDALYDKVGRPLEQLLDDCRNNFVLKQLFGFSISTKFYIKYDEPEDPNKLLEIESWRNDWLAGIVTRDEYRAKRGLEASSNGDQFYTTQALTTSTDEDKEQKEEEVFTIDFARKKSPTEQALATQNYTKFSQKWEKALSKQLETFLVAFGALDGIDEKYTPRIPKIESFYSFNDLKANISFFAGLGLDEVKKDKRVKFKAEFWDGEYPREVEDFIDKRVENILKGGEQFSSVDFETSAHIETIIKENLSFGVAHIAQKIKEAIPLLSSDRASLIAHQEVANAVEGTREIMYKKAFKDGTKEWQTVADASVRDSHKDNEKQGKIDINDKFSSGDNSPAGAFRCRCTVLYYPD
jgi:hypothetical protein